MDFTPHSLLHRLQQAGTPSDWNRLLELLAPLLQHWLRRAGAAPADADDLMQETLLALLDGLGQFQAEGQGSFRRWLYTIALNKWRDHLRRRQPQQLDPAAVLLADPQPADWFTEKEFRAHLCARALRLLQRDYPPITWQGFWETVVNGRPTAEVARELAVTPNAIYLARGRILSRLRAELGDLLD